LAIAILLEVSCKRNCGFDVLCLTGLVSAGQEDDELTVPLCVIDPVPRTYVDLELGDTVSEIAMLSGIAMHKTINAHLDTSATCAIPEPIEPISIDLSDLNAHGELYSIGYEPSTFIGPSLNRSSGERQDRRPGEGQRHGFKANNTSGAGAERNVTIDRGLHL
jgi:hypothetical protein